MDNAEEARYCEQLLRAQSLRNHFWFRRDYVLSGLMTKIEALLLQDLINLATLKKVKRKVIKEDGYDHVYFLCTVAFLERSLNWDHASQSRLLKAMEGKNFISIKHLGLPRKRYVWINIHGIEDAVDEALPQSTANTDELPCKRTVDLPCKGTVGKKDNTNVLSSNTVKKHTVAADAATEYANGFLASEEGIAPSKPAEQLARDLCELLVSKGKLTRRPALSHWAKDFQELISNVGLERVQRALEGYRRVFGMKYVPKAYSAATFCEKFVQIEDAIARIERTEEFDEDIRD